MRQGMWIVLGALALAVCVPAPPAAAVHGTPQVLFAPPVPQDLRASADGTAYNQMVTVTVVNPTTYRVRGTPPGSLMPKATHAFFRHARP